MGFKSLSKNLKISDNASVYNRKKVVFRDFSRVDDFYGFSGNLSIGRYVHTLQAMDELNLS